MTDEQVRDSERIISEWMAQAVPTDLHDAHVQAWFGEAFQAWEAADVPKAEIAKLTEELKSKDCELDSDRRERVAARLQARKREYAELVAVAKGLPADAPAQTPAHVVVASDGPAREAAPDPAAGLPDDAVPASPVKPLPKWLIRNIDYIARVNREHKCSSAQDLFRKLVELATEDNETVQKGVKHTRGKLYFVNTCSAIGDKTFGKFLPEIRAHLAR